MLFHARHALSFNKTIWGIDNDACNHVTQTVKPYTDVYQAGQCNDHMERRQSNPIQMFIKHCKHLTIQLYNYN
jgi:hypothetical protein